MTEGGAPVYDIFLMHQIWESSQWPWKSHKARQALGFCTRNYGTWEHIPLCMLLQVVGSLMHEIECILHEYLSFNWDRVEEIFDANSVYLSEDGLKCPALCCVRELLIVADVAS